MTPSASANPYKHHRFPGEIISHAVWLYFRFPLSHRDVEERLFVRCVIVSHEAIRTWGRKCGQQYANPLRRQRPRPGDKWHLDAVFITINKERYYISGGRWIKTAMSSIFSCQVAGISRRPRSSSASCSRA